MNVFKNPKYYKELQEYAKTNDGLVDGFVSKDGVIKITSHEITMEKLTHKLKNQRK